MISNLMLDGLEAVVHGSPWQRRIHNINFIRWADDFIVTANSREVLEQSVRPRIDAFLAERGIRRSPTKTVLTPLVEGFDFLGRRSVSINGVTANRPSYVSRRARPA